MGRRAPHQRPRVPGRGDQPRRRGHVPLPRRLPTLLGLLLPPPDPVLHQLRTGSDLNDFLHGYLNYQIEHHLWPNLSMLSYQRAQPLVKDICDRYGVPYVQENVFIRLKKTLDIMTGAASMKWFPAEYERKYLEADAAGEALKKESRTRLLS